MPRVSSPTFVGRADELEQLDRALAAAVARRPSTRLIAGEAGIGKTRLVATFLGRASSADAMTLVGDCLQLGDTGLPYAPFVGALRPVVRGMSEQQMDALVGPGRADLAVLLPDLGAARVRPARRHEALLNRSAAQARLFEVVFGFLRRLAEERPLVLVLEDLHWADASTRDLLRFILRNARDERLLVVGTYRPDEIHRRHPLRPLLAEVERLDGVDRIDLGAFGAVELAEQLGGIIGEPPSAELVDRVLARSGGNPLFAEELMAAGEARLGLPRTLRDTIEDRLAQLGPDGQRLVRLASVAGPRVDHRLLAEVTGFRDARLTAAVREAVEHHLLVTTTPDEVPGYAFRHALVQEVVYDELLPSERTDLHAAYARALAAGVGVTGQRAANAAQIAQHWLLAHDLPHALPAALEAARAAADGFAFAEAQAFLERALELWPKVPEAAIPAGVDRIDVLEDAAEAAAHAGDPRRSIDLIRGALDELESSGDPMRAGVLHHRLAWYLNEAGDWQAGVVAFERATTLIPIDPPTPERARVLADIAHSLMVRGRFGDSLAMGEAALAISRAVGARIAEARALNVIGLDLASRSDLVRGVPILREGNALATDLGDPLAIFLTTVGLGWGLDESARHEEALALARETHARIRHLGAEARFGGQLASNEVRALIELGRWDEAARLVDLAIAARPTNYATRWLLSNRLRLRIARGQVDDAAADLEAHEALGERVIGADPDSIVMRRAELAIVTGEPAVARGLIGETLAEFAEPDLDSDARALALVGLRAEVDEADAARAGGDAERLRVAIETAAALLDRIDAHIARVAESAPSVHPVIEADRDLARALVSRVRGEDDVHAWGLAVAGRRATGRPYEIAWALVMSAVTDLALRRRDEGAASLSEAHAIAVELGASPLRLRIESLARRARIGLEGVATADDTADRLGLTRREREVLSLLASGRSNRQIGEQLYMAESTAGVHVSNILAKLGVTRRSEAAAVAHRIGLFSLN